MKRCLVTLAAALTCAAAPLAAQDSTLTAAAPKSFGAQVVHWGKWVALGAALGFTVAAVVQHNHAQDSWDQLLALCGKDNQQCMLTPSGTYQSYDAEYLYQQTVYFDHLARHRIVLGQVSLLASVGMFVVELKRRQLAPPNIPLHGLQVLIEPASGSGARLGLSLPF